MFSKNPERVIRAETIVDASQDEVWDAWTTGKGVKSFLAPDCNIVLRVDGPYEISLTLKPSLVNEEEKV